MWIEWRKFTNDHWRFGFPTLVLTFCIASLLLLAILNLAVIGGQTRQTKQDKKSQVDESSLSEPKKSESTNPLESRATNTSTLREAGLHIKVDLRRQVLSVFDASGNVTKVLPISSGSGRWYVSEGEKRRAVTPRGQYTVYRKISGWRKSHLGLMYYPVYINGGIAIHGSPSVPRSPASHGCIRIPMGAAKAFFDTIPVGTPVLVY